MTEQQLKEIEQRWASNEVTMQTINDFNLLLAEVRRLRCCGNCVWFRNMGMWCKCRYSDSSTSGNKKCDKWEAAGNG